MPLFFFITIATEHGVLLCFLYGLPEIVATTISLKINLRRSRDGAFVRSCVRVEFG